MINRGAFLSSACQMIQVVAVAMMSRHSAEVKFRGNRLPKRVRRSKGFGAKSGAGSSRIGRPRLTGGVVADVGGVGSCTGRLSVQLFLLSFAVQSPGRQLRIPKEGLRREIFSTAAAVTSRVAKSILG